MPECEIIELHHDQKLDAPSGTAMRTAELIREAGGNVHEPIHSVRLPGPGGPPGGHLRRRGPDAHDPPRLDLPRVVHARRAAGGPQGRVARPLADDRAREPARGQGRRRADAAISRRARRRERNLFADTRAAGSVDEASAGTCRAVAPATGREPGTARRLRAPLRVSSFRSFWCRRISLMAFLAGLRTAAISAAGAPRSMRRLELSQRRLELVEGLALILGVAEQRPETRSPRGGGRRPGSDAAPALPSAAAGQG